MAALRATLVLLSVSLAATAMPVSAQLPAAGLRSESTIAGAVHGDRSCIGSLSASDRRLLALRFGIGGKPRLSDAAVAAALGLATAVVTKRELAAVRRLEIAHRHGSCAVRVVHPKSPQVLAPKLASALPASGVHSESVLATAVHAARRCLTTLDTADRNLLKLRFGIGGGARQTESAIAVRLGQSPATITRRELTAVRRLERHGRGGACRVGVSPSAQPPGAIVRPPEPRSSAGRRSTEPTPWSVIPRWVWILIAGSLLLFVFALSERLRRGERPSDHAI